MTVAGGLTLTYSRGAVAGYFVGLLTFAMLIRRRLVPEAARNFTHLKLLTLRPAMLTASILLTGMGTRLAAAAEGDPSVTNRLDLWRGALELIRERPLIGWGKGQSGISFMQWVQDPTVSRLHYGMVNSYLHLAVEFGVPTLLLFCTVVSAPINYSLSADPHRSPGRTFEALAACGASMAIFATTAFFSTIWYNSGVIWLPLCVFAVSSIVIARNSALFRPCPFTCFNLSLLTMVVAVVLLACLLSVRKSEWRMHLLPSGAVQYLPRRDNVSGVDIAIAPDRASLGQLFGREIRKAIGALPLPVRRFTVYPPEIKLEVFSPTNDFVFVLGARCAELPFATKSGHVICVSPTEPPTRLPLNAPNLALIAFPEFDEIGFLGEWRALARTENYDHIEISGVGQDLRAQWIYLIERCISSVSGVALFQSDSK